MNNQTFTPIQLVLARIGLSSPQRALQLSVTGWLLIALVGQWIFALYVLVLFGQPLFSGHPEDADFSHAITGYVVGDGVGNVMLFVHIIPAGLISLCGIFQLVPVIRNRFPAFHRWNGRVFLAMGLMGALTGLYLTWVRGSRLSDIGSLGVTLNGILILVAGVMAWKLARAKRFDSHRRWAVHAFLLINGVWTFRLYLMAWYMVNQGANGNTSTLDGPADMFISFASYGLPMLIAELVFWAQRQRQAYKKAVISAVMFVGCVITLIGVVGASMSMWLPRISQVIGVI